MRFLDAAGSGIREFPSKNDDLDASGRGWTAPNVIRSLGPPVDQTSAP